MDALASATDVGDDAEDLTAPGLVETEDGLILVQWGSGHVEGPYDPDELALVLGDEA